MNVAVVRGVVPREAEIRLLPDGRQLMSFELSVRPESGLAITVPVVADVELGGGLAQPEVGHELVVWGEVRRRFFRVGGATQSRTEVIANRVVLASDRRRVRRLLASAAAVLDAERG
jgi:single-strand DNA-binding protein